jgi:hypothetical protein
MTTINPAFVQKAYELTAFAYEQNIECPVLAGLNKWIFKQLAGEPAAASLRPASTTRPTATAAVPGRQGSFDAAVLAVVRSSPNGVDDSVLRSALAEYKKPNNQIGAAARRLEKKQLIRKRGDLWFMRSNPLGRPPAKGKAAQPASRRTRQTRAGNGAAAAAPAENPAAAATPAA